MTIDFNTTCPCFNWVEANHKQCDTCSCCEGFSPNDTQVYCNYSRVPNCEPIFKKGDIAYRITYYSVLHPQVEKGKIRNPIWKRNHWEYQFGREQHCYQAYATKEEALKVLCEEEVEHIGNRLLELKKNMGRCGLNFGMVATKLLKQ